VDAQVESSLAAEAKEDAVGPLDVDDMGNILGGDGQVVDLVSELVVGLDGGDVGVDQDRLDAGFFEGLEGLGA
jgi:hypothetical protein